MEAKVIAGRYAQALFEVINREAWDATVSELEGMLHFLEENDSVEKMLISPTVPDDVKTKVLNTILEKAEFSKDVESFFRVLLDKDRFVLLKEIVASMKEIIQRHRNMISVKIKSYRSLADEEIQQIVGKLSQISGKQLEYEIEIDQSLMCGIVAEVGNVIYDFSLKNKLKHLKTELLNA